MAVFRDGDARFRHVAKFKPQRGLQAAAGVTNALSAVAMQAQLAAIERAIADVADLVKSVAGKLDDRFYAELAATEGLLRETYRAATASGYLSDLMWDQIAPLALLVRQNQEYADHQLRRLVHELQGKKSVKDRRSWLKSKRGEVQEALESVERASRMSAQFGSLRLWRLSVANDVALPFYSKVLRDQLPAREEAVLSLHAALLHTLEGKQPGSWTSFHSPFDSRRVRAMLKEVGSLLDEIAPPSTQPASINQALPAPIGAGDAKSSNERAQ